MNLRFNPLNIYPLPLMLALLVVQYVFGRYPSFALILARPIGLVAVGIALVGVLLMLVAAVTMRCHRTTVIPGQAPQQLLQSGIFRVSRNPMYLGMLLLLTTIPLMATQPRLLIFTALFFVIMNFYVIPREERIIRQTFGASYDAYAARVRRWVG